MPYNRSTPAETFARLEAEIRLEIEGSDPNLRYSPERILARLVAMASYEMDGFIEYAMKQILITTCDVEYIPLHAYMWGEPQNQAQAATGSVQFSGNDGATVPAGTAVRRQDGQEYILAADVTMVGGTGTGTVTASVTGAAGNAAAATTLTLASPVPGIQSAASVAAPGLSGGVDLEDPESWRARIIERVQNPPHGGTEEDYKMWAKRVPGVTRVWVYPNQLGRGSVYLLFVMDNKADTIIPTPIEVALVQALLNAVCPVTADVTVAAPTAVPQDFTINILPNTVAVQNAITAELADLIRRESVPGGTLLLSHMREVISVAAGEGDHVLVAPAANVARSFAQITTLGTLTFGGI